MFSLQNSTVFRDFHKNYRDSPNRQWNQIPSGCWTLLALSMCVLNCKKQLFIICFYKNAAALILPGKLFCEMEKAIVHSFGKVFVT